MLHNLKNFMSFLYYSIKIYEHCEKMLPRSTQTGQLYRTLKTHKSKNMEKITLENLKCCPIIAQADTYTCNENCIVAEYLKPLSNSNEYTVRNTQKSSEFLQQQKLLLLSKRIYITQY